MEQFQYRSKARIIAIVDLVLTSMSLWIPLIFFVSAVGLTVVSKNPELQKKAKEAIAEASEHDDSLSTAMGSDDDAAKFGAIAVVFWILFVIFAIVVIVQLVAAVKLVNATQIGKDAVGAAKLSRFWRNCTIVFTVLLVLGGLKPNSVFEALFNWVCVVLRCIGIYVVHKFITELDLAVRTGTGILPSHHGQVPMNPGMAYSYIPPQQGQGNSPPNYDEVVKEKQ